MAKKVKAAGGIIYKDSGPHEESQYPALLLIYRRKLWDLPKGKMESDETRQECAIREVSEEIGADEPVIKGDLGTTYHEYSRNDQRYRKTTFWYAMQIHEENSLTPQKEEDIEEIEWFSLYDAKEKVAFDNLKKLLDRFEVWYWEKS